MRHRAIHSAIPRPNAGPCCSRDPEAVQTQEISTTLWGRTIAFCVPGIINHSADPFMYDLPDSNCGDTGFAMVGPDLVFPQCSVVKGEVVIGHGRSCAGANRHIVFPFGSEMHARGRSSAAGRGPAACGIEHKGYSVLRGSGPAGDPGHAPARWRSRPRTRRIDTVPAGHGSRRISASHGVTDCHRRLSSSQSLRRTDLFHPLRGHGV